MKVAAEPETPLPLGNDLEAKMERVKEKKSVAFNVTVRDSSPPAPIADSERPVSHFTLNLLEVEDLESLLCARMGLGTQGYSFWEQYWTQGDVTCGINWTSNGQTRRQSSAPIASSGRLEVSKESFSFLIADDLLTKSSALELQFVFKLHSKARAEALHDALHFKRWTCLPFTGKDIRVGSRQNVACLVKDLVFTWDMKKGNWEQVNLEVSVEGGDGEAKAITLTPHCIDIGADGSLWCCDAQGVFRRDDGNWTRLAKTGVVQIDVSSKNKACLLTKKRQLYVFDTKRNNFQRKHWNHPSWKPKDASIGSNNELFCLKGNSVRVHIAELRPSWVPLSSEGMLQAPAKVNVGSNAQIYSITATGEVYRFHRQETMPTAKGSFRLVSGYWMDTRDEVIVGHWEQVYEDLVSIDVGADGTLGGTSSKGSLLINLSSGGVSSEAPSSSLDFKREKSMSLARKPSLRKQHSLAEDFNSISFGSVSIPLKSIPSSDDLTQLSSALAAITDEKRKKSYTRKVKRLQDKIDAWSDKWFPVAYTDDLQSLKLERTQVKLGLSRKPAPPASDKPYLKFKLDVPGIGLSMIDATPQEIMYLCINGVHVELTDSESSQTIQLELKRFQMDNQLPSAVFPIIIAPTAVKGDPLPFISLSVNREKDDTVPFSKFRGLKLLIQSLDVEVEEKWIWDLVDFAGNLAGSSGEQEMDPLVVHDVVRKHVSKIMTPPESLVAAQASSFLFFNVLNLEPIAINLSFESNPTNKATTPELNASSVIMSALMYVLGSVGALAGCIDRAPLRFSGKTFENAYGDVNTLIWPVINHYISQGILEAYKLFGSVEVLGNPVGLISNVSDGVSDFFYEPAQGLKSSPQDFAKGLGKGTSSLLTKGVGGTFGAASKITGSLSKGLSVLSMDDDFIASRRKKGRNKPKHAGDGLADGGMSLASGIFSGVTGLVTDPLKGAQQNGLSGFATGLGKGVVGLIAKPLVGAVDGITNTLQGVGNTMGYLVGDEVENTRTRPQRYIDPQTKSIAVYDLGLAQMQAEQSAATQQSLLNL